MPQNTFVDVVVIEKPGLPLGFRRYVTYHNFENIMYFQFGWPYCYFRLPVVVKIIVLELGMVDSSIVAVGK